MKRLWHQRWWRIAAGAGALVVLAGVNEKMNSNVPPEKATHERGEKEQEAATS